MDASLVADLLRDAIGLKITAIGDAAVKRALGRRMRALGVTDPAGYLACVRQSEQELGELVEEVVVPETWFFRDERAFAVLAEFARQVWARAHPERRLRLLSIPCATGEEPYSLAMAMLQASWPSDRLRIEGVDISRRALARAREGLYGAHSFRGHRFGFRDRFFTVIGERYRITDAVRAVVRLRPGNLLDAQLPQDLGIFDAIFCRNLLIYFDRPCQEQALAALERMLADDGLLFVGHAESGILIDSPFVHAGYAQAFAYAKGQRRLAVARPPEARPEPPAPPPRLPPPPPLPALVAPARQEPPVKPPQERPDLDTIRRLADQGQLTEALRLCGAFLAHEQGSEAEAFFLMGVLLDATGELKEAAVCLRKALYLNPEHLEALIHLGLVSERLGDRAGAAACRERARRLADRPPAPLAGDEKQDARP
ncbi:MAG: CheR family methyltransferase [Thermodesulfobacteriota bacterium]